MKTFLLAIACMPGIVFSQEAKIKTLSIHKLSDSLILQTCEITIYNNSPNPLCLKIAPTFREKILSKDTIQLASLSTGLQCPEYDLWISESLSHLNVTDYPSYPLVINTRAAFIAFISFIKPTNCEKIKINFSFLNQGDIKYCDLIEKFKSGQAWTNKLKFRNNKIEVH